VSSAKVGGMEMPRYWAQHTAEVCSQGRGRLDVLSHLLGRHVAGLDDGTAYIDHYKQDKADDKEDDQ
jgi:hypothetical protein